MLKRFTLLNRSLLRRNIELNSYEDRVDVYEEAISDVSGRALFAISTLPNQHRLRAPSGDERKPSIEVATVSLDEFLADKEVDVIRMDLEGAEWLVVKGMKGILSGNRPLLMFIEMHPELIKDYGGDAVAMLKLFMDAGFNIRYVVASFWRGISLSHRCKAKRRLLKPQPGLEFDIQEGDPFLSTAMRRILEGTDCYRVFLERSSPQ